MARTGKWILLIFLGFSLSACTLDSLINSLNSHSRIDLDVDSSFAITSSNANSVPIEGTCFPDEALFTVISPVNKTGIPCSHGHMSEVLDLSSVGDGPVTVVFNDENQNKPFNFHFIKDTIPPQNVELEINGGATLTSSPALAVKVTGVDIAEVYITESFGCIVGGSWEVLSDSSNWNASPGDGLKTIYVKTRDAYSNESACISGTIKLDTTAPSSLLSYTGGSSFYTSTFDLTITPSESISGLTLGSFTTTNASLSNLVKHGSYYTVTVTPITDGSVQVQLNSGSYVDAAGILNTDSPSISRIYQSTSSIGYIPESLISDNFVSFIDGALYKCDMSAASSCVAVPTYVDTNSVTASLRAAKLLKNGNIVASGEIVDGSYSKSVVALYDYGTSSWTELDRYQFLPTYSSGSYALALSPLGSIATIIKSKDANGYVNIVTREYLVTDGIWQTTDSFHISGVIGQPSWAAYDNDDNLYVAGTLYNSSTKGTGVIRRKENSTGLFSTLDTYLHSNTETTYNSFTIANGKVIVVGWIGASIRQLLIRDCDIVSSICTTRYNASYAAADTYGYNIISKDGDTVFIAGSNRGGPSNSTRAFQASFKISTSTFTVNHAYQLISGNYTLQSGLGMATDDRIWMSGAGYDGSVMKKYMNFYSPTGALTVNYVY